MNPNLDIHDTPIDRRCVACGDDTDTRLARVYTDHYHWICWDSVACERRQNAEAAWAEQRWTITEAGRAALVRAEKGEAA